MHSISTPTSLHLNQILLPRNSCCTVNITIYDVDIFANILGMANTQYKLQETIAGIEIHAECYEKVSKSMKELETFSGPNSRDQEFAIMYNITKMGLRSVHSLSFYLRMKSGNHSLQKSDLIKFQKELGTSTQSPRVSI